ncbi:prepilin-type N-terminal cleavage/methylation domain-containing protein [Herbaspirillum sp. AP02]|uniref:type II secretion system protein n=1 Tax=unclassified Herbaspirillum TaxID=2624150 RepID=UPI0015DAA212|nr:MULTISPECIES: prepilin-type N-terminal cleavage/methylation domain-containing protein [unclassified Herbaspirillum]MBG7617935.1 prepilin-type N-terminal cleavage/methylation domain-containing protein [Herbaspirillum sp. AP02]NZD70121.1 prepilin-type N-terminal cleavage/methylation domain-containing protein [Herbaspirillum sp. AP21]
MRKNNSGYTLVELSVVMALAGMIVLGSIAGATSLLDQHRINELSAENADAIKRVNETYAQLPSYGGLSLRQAVSFGAFKQFIINQRATDRVTVTHPFGGALGVAPLTGGTAWGLYLNAIPARYCADLLFQSAPMADALIVFPNGMDNPIGWSGSVVFDASVPAVSIGPSFGGAAPRIAKNLSQDDLAPAALALACTGAGNNFGLLLLKSKLR